MIDTFNITFFNYGEDLVFSFRGLLDLLFSSEHNFPGTEGNGAKMGVIKSQFDKCSYLGLVLCWE